MTNSTLQSSELKPQITKESFNFKAVIFRYLKYWPYFLFSIILCLLVAYFVTRYATPRYNISSTLLIKDSKGSSSGANDFLEGLQLLKTSRNIENEIGVMRSYTMAVNTLKELDFGVSYFKDGSVKTSELYGDFPVKVIVDTSHIQISSIFFEISILNKNQFHIRAETKTSLFSDILIKLGLKSKDILPFKEGTYYFGEQLSGEAYRFTVFLSPKMGRAGEVLQFKINTFQSLVGSYSGRVGIGPINKAASILRLDLESTIPQKDIAYLNKFMEVYIKIGLEEKNLIATNTIQFIDAQLGGVTDSLNFVENKLQQFRTANKAVDLSAEGNTVFARLSELEKQRSVEDIKLKYYDYLRKYIAQHADFKGVTAPSVMGIEDPLTNTLIASLIQLYDQRSALGFNAKENNPVFIEITNRIQALNQTLTENIQNTIKATRIVTNDIQNRIRLAEAEINRLPRTERDLVNIKRKFSLNENLYIYLLEKRAEAGIAKAANLPDSKVIDSATSSSAIYPNISSNYRTAFLIGFALPIAIIFLIGYLDNSINSREELEALTDISILGVVMHSDRTTNLVVANNPKSAVSETFRSLRSNLQYLASDKERKVILITSSISGEGKTFCAINLASVLALTGKKTILMGVDLRKPKIFNDFDLPNEIGLSTYLIGKAEKEEVINSTPISSLDIITAGPVAPNPSELLMVTRFGELIHQLRDSYEYIVFDSPPLGLVADSFELMRYADVTLYMVRQNYTQKDNLHSINDLYRKGSVKNVSIVLNDYKVEAGYGYGASYGYGYGYYEEDTKPQSIWRKIVNVTRKRV